MKLILATILIALPFSVRAQNINFDDLPNLVRQKNGNAKAAELTHLAAKERTGYLKRSFLPSLEAKGGLESAKIGSSPQENLGYWSVEARLNIFRGGRDLLENKVAESRARALGASAEKDFQTELKMARQYYWHLTATRILISQVKEALERNEENLKSAKKRSGAGVATAADSLQFDLEKTLLTQQLKRLEHEDDVLRNKLAVSLGFASHESLSLNPDFPHPPEAEFQEKTLVVESHPEVTALRESENTERLRGKQAGRWYMPKLDLYGKYGLPSLADDYALAVRKDKEFVAGVSLSLDLGQSFQSRAAERSQVLESQALAQKRQHLEKSVVAESHELQHDLRLIHELLHDAERDIQRAQNFLNLTRSEYSRGVKNGPDLLEAFGKLFEFKKRNVELNLEYQLAKTEFAALTAKVSSK